MDASIEFDAVERKWGDQASIGALVGSLAGGVLGGAIGGVVGIVQDSKKDSRDDTNYMFSDIGGILGGFLGAGVGACVGGITGVLVGDALRPAKVVIRIRSTMTLFSPDNRQLAERHFVSMHRHYRPYGDTPANLVGRALWSHQIDMLEAFETEVGPTLDALEQAVEPAEPVKNTIQGRPSELHDAPHPAVHDSGKQAPKEPAPSKHDDGDPDSPIGP